MRSKKDNVVIAFIKKETVLCAAAALAVISMFAVPPDQEYGTYLDYRVLALLFCLMLVIAGLQNIGLFRYLGLGLLKKPKIPCSLALPWWPYASFAVCSSPMTWH